MVNRIGYVGRKKTNHGDHSPVRMRESDLASIYTTVPFVHTREDIILIVLSKVISY